MSRPSYSTLILDLGDVLFSWSATTKTTIPPNTLKSLMSSPPWLEYECGRITQEVCYDQVGERFALPPSEVAEAFLQARDSLQSNDTMISLVHELKESSNGALRVYAMSNISEPDYNVLAKKPADWSVFDQVFTSAHAGMRKPGLPFYRHVLEATHTAPQDAIFVDDKFENVFAARSLGLHGVVFDNTANVSQKLRNLLGNPVRRGKEYLSRNAKQFHTITDSNIVIQENYAQILILGATNNEELVQVERQARKWNFFSGEPALTTATYPDDLDTTALALTIMDYDKEVVSSVMDEMLEYVNDEGIIMVYYDHNRPRIDSVICVNILTLFYRHGRGHQLGRTLQWIREVLLHRAYLDGTFYYKSAECFLFYLGRLLGCTQDAELHRWLEPLLKERVQERIGQSGSALDLAMRILTCSALGIKDQVDLDGLLSLQCEDGGWGLDWMYRYARSGIEMGNRGVTTALAINAIESATSMATNLKDESVAVSMEEGNQVLERSLETQVAAG